jgi:hypothetical protein
MAMVGFVLATATAAIGAEPRIQVALLLDDSGSMGGLIEQAKAQLWTFVNELASSRKGGKAPSIEVALYRHGGPVRHVVSLTNDLDVISERLFAVTIQGNGSEHCGEAIKAAVDNLAWSTSADDLKIVFIAGNEPFTQGPVAYADACKAAIAKGIVVNTIHCGGESEGVSGKWKDGALLAEGTFFCIDQNRKLAHIEAPQDKEIVRLGEELNKTYIAFGNKGQEGWERQQTQNANAAGISAESGVARYVAQAQTQYRNAAWDLVDATRDGQAKIEDLKAEDLPENMRSMTLAERKDYAAATAKQRAAIQKQINQVNEERRKYVTEKRKTLSGDGESLDSAMIKTIRSQAARHDFVFTSVN